MHEDIFIIDPHKGNVFPTYGSQSIDLLCKTIDWFLYIMKTLALG